MRFMQRHGVLIFAIAAALPSYPAAQPVAIASYSIDARLDADKHTVDGSEILTWLNDSTDQVGELQFHLYMNAFKNESSTFFRESGGQLRGDTHAKDNWGWIDIAQMRLVDGPDLTSAIQFIHPDNNNAADRTVIRVPLATPVAPGQTIHVSIKWKTQFPEVYARTGYHGTFLLAGQWFPKIGVYEKAGERYAAKGQWNCHQFHANSEFYADYGTYDVHLTVPSNEVMGATGVLQSRVVKGGTAEYRFHQDNVHDFAWTVQPTFEKIERTFYADREVSSAELAEAAKNFEISPEEARLSDVHMILLIQPEHSAQIERHFTALRNAIKYFGLWYGRYPHPTITLVDPPYGAAGAGGMEYPTFITGGTSWLVSDKENNPEEVIVHEFGHQFWQGLVGSNEFEEAWMDEGFNTYSTGKVLDRVYGPGMLPLSVRHVPLPWFVTLPRYNSDDFDRTLYLVGPKADDLFRSAWEYQSDLSYGLNSYMRTGLMLRTLENILGAKTMARVMRAYQQKWRYGHPAAPDFIRTVNDVSGKDMTGYFAQTLYGSNVLDYSVAGVTSEPVKTPAGVFGEPPHQSTVTLEQAEKADEKLEKDKKVLYRSRITIRRDGEIVWPVDIRITMEGGKVRTEHWDGQYRWTRFDFTDSHKVSAVEIDPDHKLLLDIDFANNSHLEEPQPQSPFKWSSTLLFWAQNILQGLEILA